MKKFERFRKAFERAQAEKQRLVAQKEVEEAALEEAVKKREALGFSTWKDLGKSVEADKEDFSKREKSLDEILGPYLEDVA